MSPILLIKVVDDAKGNLVPDAKISPEWAVESKKYLAPGNRTVSGFTKRSDGTGVPTVSVCHGEDFTVTVQAPATDPTRRSSTCQTMR